MKDQNNLISYRMLIIGIGIGLIIATVLFMTFGVTRQLTKFQIEEKAKSFGMDYPQDFKVIN